MSLLTSDQWRALLVAARVGNAAITEANVAFAYPVQVTDVTNIESIIIEAFGELVREGKIE